jgi:hypothetical protein
MKKLKRPEMSTRHRSGSAEIKTREPDEFISHCESISYILAKTVFLWRANRKIKRYLELTGAKLDEI